MFESSPLLKKDCTPWGTREAVVDANYALQSSKIFDGAYVRSASEFAADELQGIYRADEQDLSWMAVNILRLFGIRAQFFCMASCSAWFQSSLVCSH